jgi:flagellar capping protein FliD
VVANSFTNTRALFSGLSATNTGLANKLHSAFKSLSDDVTGVVRNTITGNENSIKGLNKSISDQLDRINALRQSLSRQFAAADAAISQLNNQGSALTNIFTAQSNATGSSKK